MHYRLTLLLTIAHPIVSIFCKINAAVWTTVLSVLPGTAVTVTCFSSKCQMATSRIEFGQFYIRTCRRNRVATVRKNVWKIYFFPGQGKVREFCGWPAKFSKDLESQGKVREFENKCLNDSLQKIYSVQKGKGCTFS